jgi:hypothetical protein
VSLTGLLGLPPLFLSLLVGAALLGLGYLLVDAVISTARLDVIARWALSLTGAVAYALVLMVLHMASGGRVFSHPTAVRWATFLLAAALMAGKILRERKLAAELAPRPVEIGALTSLLLLNLVVWGWPLLHGLPEARGDAALHTGWASQLLNGDTAPSSALVGDIPNAYPWLFHAVLASVTLFTPGGHTLMALGPLLVMQVGGLVLALFALGREMGGRWSAGAYAALFGVATGGFGFLLGRSPELVFSARSATGSVRYMGDFLARRSYNLSFHNLWPPLPRDLGFALVPAFLLLLLIGLRNRSDWFLVGTGTVLGLMGLTSPDGFIVCAAVVLLLAVFLRRAARLRAASLVGLPALALYLLWLGPLLVSYLDLGGFRDLSAEPVALPAIAILFSWGVSVPFAVYGLVRWVPRVTRKLEARLLLAYAVAAGALIVSSFLFPRLLGEGFTVLGRPHRYWPLLYLAVALYAALGAAEAIARLAGRRRALGGALLSVTVAAAIASPALGTLDVDYEGLDSYLGRSMTNQEPTLLSTLYPSVERGCVVAARPRVAADLWRHTGYRFVFWGRAGSRDPFVRWANIFETVPSIEERLRDSELLVRGRGAPRVWQSTAGKYAVDVVVTSPRFRDRPAFRSYDAETVTSGRGDALLVEVKPCAPP